MGYKALFMFYSSLLVSVSCIYLYGILSGFPTIANVIFHIIIAGGLLVFVSGCILGYYKIKYGIQRLKNYIRNSNRGE